MVESICGQGFAYMCEVEEDLGKISSQTRAKGSYRQKAMTAENLGQNLIYAPDSLLLL
jgi:hypothetical protein